MDLFDSKHRRALVVFLVVTTVIGYFANIALVTFANITDARLAQVIGLITTVQNAFMIIIGYFFGSSSGSAKKTDMMSDISGTGDGTTKTTATIKTEINKTATTETNPPEPLTPPAPPETTPPPQATTGE
jgi:hypothetical protein